jgi:hypothetical protein
VLDHHTLQQSRLTPWLSTFCGLLLSSEKASKFGLNFRYGMLVESTVHKKVNEIQILIYLGIDFFLNFFMISIPYNEKWCLNQFLTLPFVGSTSY